MNGIVDRKELHVRAVGDDGRPASTNAPAAHATRALPGSTSGQLAGAYRCRRHEGMAHRFDGVTLMAQPAEQRAHQRLVTQEVRPFRIIKICRNNRRALAIPLFHQLEEDVGLLAIAYSILGSCRLAGVDPREYLADVLPRLTGRISLKDLPDLLPSRWATARAGVLATARCVRLPRQRSALKSIGFG